MTKAKAGKNVLLPTMDDESCHICITSKPLVVLRGNHGASCNYCGNEIALCGKCYIGLTGLADKLLGVTHE